MVAAGQTDLCLALPGTIMQTGNYHFNASSIGGAVDYTGGHLKLTRAENSQPRRKEGKTRREQNKGAVRVKTGSGLLEL